MKKVVLFALMMFVSTAIEAQEKMKVVMTDGTTQLFYVNKVEKVFFEGEEIVLTTGTATEVTPSSAKFTYTVSGISKVISTGIIISTSSSLTHDNYLKGKSTATQKDGTYSVTFDGLSPSTTYYYRAYAKYGDDYCYGNIRSFTTKSSNLIYQEPYTNWGATISQTKTYMSGYTIYKETTTNLSYYGNYTETLIAYSFENSKLVSAGVAVAINNTTQSALDAQLRNNYKYVNQASDGAYLYLSYDGRTMVVLTTNDDNTAYLVAYYDYNWYMNKSAKAFEVPYVNWGATRSTVKSAVAAMGYILYDESTLAAENYRLVYYGKDKEILILYAFDSSQRLNNVVMTFPASDMSLANMRNYLTSTLSYTYEGANNSNQYIYVTPDGKSYAVVFSRIVSDAEYTYLSYLPRSSSSSSPAYLRTSSYGALNLEEVMPNTNLNIDIITLQHDRIMKAYEKRGIVFPYK